jgi:hypothetical protein
MPPSLSSLASALGSSDLGSRYTHVAIVELDKNDVDFGAPLRFQYFPESITDTKQVNWSPKDVPGGSLPIYQWNSSGERAITFNAVFTTDIDFSMEALGSSKSASTLESLKSTGESARNVDIRSAILWLRRFMMPSYEDGGNQLTTAPRKLQLHMPGTGIGMAHGGHSGGLHDGKDYITALMTGCDVTWVQFFPSGFPRIATVALSFVQIAQFNSVICFPGVSDKLDSTVYAGLANGSTGDSEVYQYTLRAQSWKK